MNIQYNTICSCWTSFPTNSCWIWYSYHIQYNTTDLWYCPSYRKFRSALTRLSSADAVVLQSNCVQVIVSDEARTLTLRVTGRVP